MSAQPAVKLADFEDALMFVDTGDLGNTAWVCRATGAVLYHGEDYGDFGPLPADIDDATRYVPIPDKHELGLGKPLALEFARTQLPACFDEVRAMFAHRGAYARFKHLLERHQQLDAWHQWEEAQTRQSLRDWCADNGITLAE